MNNIIFGTYKITAYDQMYLCLDMAIQHGIRHFDTAELYKNHIIFGQILNILLKKYNLKRSEIYITSKISMKTLKKNNIDIIKSIDQIFIDLNLDYLDLLLVHRSTNDNHKNSNIWTLLSNYNNNKINNIGLSNFNLNDIIYLNNYINSNNLLNIYCNQIELNPFVYNIQKSLIKYCLINNIIVQAYGIFYYFNDLNKISDYHYYHNDIIKWLKCINVIPIIKTTNIDHLFELLNIEYDDPTNINCIKLCNINPNLINWKFIHY